jgi:uncharacterized Tic20 family protein
MTAETESTSGVSKDVCNWAMLCHLSALVGLLGNGIGFLLGPLIVWLLKRDMHPFVDEQGKEAVNFQITMFIAFFVAAVLIFILIGIPLLIALGILDVVLPIVAAIKTSNGEHYRYPFALRLIK